MEELTQLCPESTCIPFMRISKIQKSADAKIELKEDFNLISALERTYNVIQAICSYLPYWDLINIRPLSDVWKLYIDEEITRRGNPFWLQFTSCENKYNKLLQSSKNYELVSPGFSIILFNLEKISLDKYVCVHKDVDDLERKSLYSHLADDIALPGSKFVCFSLKNVHDYILNDSSERTLYSWFHIPPIPNIRLLPFYYESQKQAKEFFNEHLNEYEHIDTLLIFTVRDPGKQLKSLTNLIRSRQKLNVSFGGGVVWGMKSNTTEKRIIKRSDLFCLMFIRNKTLEDDEFFSASCMIRNSFEKNILKFKSKLVFRKHSMLFRFCCCAKFESEEEDMLLRKYFPSVHLVQMDVNGEFGCNYSPADYLNEGDQRKVLAHMQYMHGFTSMMVFISWGKHNI